eukprot:TRINITY_DN12145_c0_g1_i6.p2 TRINITY_DN12145_c0_g1~~TRINITY_DN12145_c0_g1_i6.p2  ORF type:complete len:119 (-),score=12.54 TRINITY_DN12145_c0_g1_i6:588-944(-)
MLLSGRSGGLAPENRLTFLGLKGSMVLDFDTATLQVNRSGQEEPEVMSENAFAFVTGTYHLASCLRRRLAGGSSVENEDDEIGPLADLATFEDGMQSAIVKGALHESAERAGEWIHVC